jgi:hypothetical protein
MEKTAVILYGMGGELGDFKVFANTLKLELAKTYSKVTMQYVTRDTEFFKILQGIDSTKEVIEELHVFSHSIGAGLFIGYNDPSILASRLATWKLADSLKRKVTFNEVLLTEVGGIQTDDLKRDVFVKQQKNLQAKFSKTAFIKIWGCNSGVANWVYSDAGIIDPADKSQPYYWRAFNEANTPKPAIAKAFATFFGVKVYGAHSGASIEVKHKQTWMSSRNYKAKIGHWPSGALPHRLVPDKGSYYEYLP